MSEQKIGYLKLILSVFIGSSVGLFVRWVNVSSVAMTFYTQFSAVVACLIYLLLKKQIKTIPRGKKILPMIIIGLIGVVNFITTFLAYQNTTIANVVLIFNTAPIIIVLLTPLFINEKYEKRIFFLLPIAFLGIIIMTGHFDISLTSFLGILYALLSAISYSFLVILSKKFLSDYLPIYLVLFLSLVGVVVLFPYILINRMFVSSQILLILFFQGVFLYAFNPLIFYQGLKLVKAQHASLLMYLSPVIAIFYGFIFLNEIPTINSLIGGAIILSTALYLTLSSIKNQNK